MIPHKYTRTYLEIFLALYYDLYTGKSAEKSIEGAGDDKVDIISPPYEGKGKRDAKS
jgi:hypothetical protein